MDGVVPPPASNSGVVIERPFLQFGAEDHNRFTDPTWAAFWANLHGWRRELQIDGAGHLDFTDLGLLLDQLGLDKHVLFPGGFGSIRPPGRSRSSRPTSGRSSPSTCAVDPSGCSTARRAGSQR